MYVFYKVLYIKNAFSIKYLVMYSDYGYSILYNLLVEEKTSWNAVSIKQVALFANHHS